MVQVEPITVRVKFRKIGKLQYISHLDLVRTMMKLIVRAELPLKYTEGFNPKPKVSFAAPLSTGVESECEFMDVRLEERMAEDEIINRLNRGLTDELHVISVYYPTTKFTSLGFLSYEIVIDTSGADAVLAERINETIASPTLLIRKKTKSGERDVDIKPGIKSAEALYDGENIVIKCVLSASPDSFLSPELLVRVLRRECGILSSENIISEGYSIMRKNAYFADMSEFK